MNTDPLAHRVVRRYRGVIHGATRFDYSDADKIRSGVDHDVAQADGRPTAPVDLLAPVNWNAEHGRVRCRDA